MLKLAVSPLMTAAIAAMGTGMLLEQQHLHKEHLKEEALRELELRQLEARRMLPTRMGLHTAGGFSPSLTNYGNLQDYDPGLDFDFEKGGAFKQAGIGGQLIGAVGKAVGGAAGKVQQFGQSAVTKGRSMVGALRAPAAAAAPVAAAAAPVAAVAKSTPFLSTDTKAKILGGAAIAGTGYVGYKGVVKPTVDYMRTPAHAHHEGYMSNNVNEYGYS